MAEAKYSETKSIIKKVFLELYRNEPLYKIKVGKLCEKSSVSRGTFYFYFDDIYALYNEITEEILSQTRKGTDELSLSTVSADPKRFADGYAQYLENNLKPHKDILKLMLSGSEQNEFRRAFYNDIRNQYGKAMTFSKDVSTEVKEYKMSFFAGGVMETFTTWILSDCAMPVKEVTNVITDSIFWGIYKATEK